MERALPFHPGHGGGKLRVGQGLVQRVEGIQLLLDVGQHLVHIAAAGVERHFMLHYSGRADLLCRAEHHGSAAQRYQQRPQLICWQRRAQHREH